MLEIGDIDSKNSKSASSSDDSSYSAASDDHKPSESASKPAQVVIDGHLSQWRLPYSQSREAGAGAQKANGVS